MTTCIHLFNGVLDPQENLIDDFGSDGPVFGPYSSVQVTYGHHVKMYMESPTGIVGNGIDCKYPPRPELNYIDGYVYYNGVYYGDMETYTPDTREIYTEWHSELTRLKEN